MRPREPVFFRRTRNCYLDMGKNDSAKAFFQNALLVNSAYLPALNDLGNLLLYEGEIAEADPYFERIVKLEKNNKGAFVRLRQIKNLKGGQFFEDAKLTEISDKAEVYLDQNKFQKALAEYLRIKNIEDLRATWKTQLAKYYFGLGDTIKALKYIKLSYNQDSTIENTLALLACKSESIRSLSANTDYYYNRALRLFPDGLFLLQANSNYYFRIKNFKRCLEIGTIADKKFFHDRLISSNSALSALLLKNYYVARTKFEFLNLMYPSSDTIMAYPAYTYLSMYYTEKRSAGFKKGIELAKKAYELNSKNSVTISVSSRYSDVLTTVAIKEASASKSTSARIGYQSKNQKR